MEDRNSDLTASKEILNTIKERFNNNEIRPHDIEYLIRKVEKALDFADRILK